jgi:RNA-directed DNA polymerase
MSLGTPQGGVISPLLANLFLHYRFTECKLTVHPEKTKIVYCRDRSRKQGYDKTEFDFLGFTFRPRIVRDRYDRYSLGFTPAISKRAEIAIRDTIKRWKLHRRTGTGIKDIAKEINPKIRGWLNYYGAFRPSALHGICRMIQGSLINWARRKYKTLRKRFMGAVELLLKIRKECNNLFVHWEPGWYTQIV